MNVETKARSYDFESCTEYLTSSVAGMATLLWWSPYGSSAWKHWGCLSYLFSPPKPLGLPFHRRYYFWPWYLIASFYPHNQNAGKCWPRQESPLRCLKLKDLLRSLQGLTFSDFSTMSNSKCSHWTLVSLDLTSQIPVHTVWEKSRWCFCSPLKIKSTFLQVKRETTLHGTKSAEEKTPTTTMTSTLIYNRCIPVSFVIFDAEQNNRNNNVWEY